MKGGNSWDFLLHFLEEKDLKKKGRGRVRVRKLRVTRGLGTGTRVWRTGTKHGRMCEVEKGVQGGGKGSPLSRSKESAGNHYYYIRSQSESGGEEKMFFHVII